LFALAATDFEPARLESGSLSVETVQEPFTGRGEVLLELAVDASGRVTQITTLRSTPPFAEPLENAVRQWRFAPARASLEEEEGLSPVDSRVLVAGVFRPQTLYDAPAMGEAPEDAAPASDAVPFPASMPAPVYPPHAGSHTGHIVIVEVEVGDDGKVTDAKVLRSSPGFDEVSLDAARGWTFRPARRDGRAVPANVYVVFGFREPVSH
jgi:TonB family protein